MVRLFIERLFSVICKMGVVLIQNVQKRLVNKL